MRGGCLELYRALRDGRAVDLEQRKCRRVQRERENIRQIDQASERQQKAMLPFCLLVISRTFPVCLLSLTLFQLAFSLFLSLAANDSGQYVPIVAFDCRGLEPTKWYPESGYTVISAGGKEFTEVELREDWAEYDEDAGESVGVYGLEYKLEVHRG